MQVTPAQMRLAAIQVSEQAEQLSDRTEKRGANIAERVLDSESEGN